MKNIYLRGELYYADLGTGIGSEQNGYRPVVIIQNDVGNRHSPTTIVAAISTQIKTKANLPTHYHLKPGSGLVQPSMVMLEQIRTVDKTRLVQYIGKLSDGEIKGLNHALAVSIGLIPTTVIRDPDSHMKFLPAIIKEGNDLNFVIYKDFSKFFSIQRNRQVLES